jgi:protein ImuA
MAESAERLAALKRKLERLTRNGVARPEKSFDLGAAGLDQRLGGLRRGCLHELFAVEPEDTASAAAFALMLAIRADPADRPLLWLRQLGSGTGFAHLHAPGLCELGLNPGRLIEVLARDAKALLRAAVDIVRCPSVGVLILEPWRNPKELDLTASRRLSVAAEQNGATVLMIRSDAHPEPSSAYTRWAVASAAALPLDADAPGYPTFDINLLRHRGGLPAFSWRVEWDRDQRSFQEAGTGSGAGRKALPGNLVSLPTGRPSVPAQEDGAIRRRA